MPPATSTAAAQVTKAETEAENHSGATLRLASHWGRTAENAPMAAKGNRRRPATKRSLKSVSLQAFRTTTGAMIRSSGAKVPMGTAETPYDPTSATARMSDVTAVKSCPSDTAFTRFVAHPVLPRTSRNPSRRTEISIRCKKAGSAPMRPRDQNWISQQPPDQSTAYRLNLMIASMLTASRNRRPSEALQFLRDVPQLESGGVVVRTPEGCPGCT